MFHFLSEEDTQFFRTYGYVVVKNIIPKPHRIARSIIREVKKIIFTTKEELETLIKLEEKDIDPLQLLVDNKLREEHLDNPKSIWHNNNIRTPKIAKSSGMTNIYHNKRVREKILFNEDIYNVVNSLYTSLTGVEEDIIYLYGPDRVCVKPKGATHMPKHIDCNLVCYEEEEENKTAPTNPLTMFRVQVVTCLQIDTEAKNNGRTEVLSGYNNYFLLGAYYFRKSFTTDNKPGRYFSPLVVEEIFSKHLNTFLEYIDSFYHKKKLLPKEETPLSKNKELFQRIYDSLPKKKIKIEWTTPEVAPGDIFCFDQRLPHRNTKNDSEITRVASFVSLYPKSYLREDDISPYKLFGGKIDKSRPFDNNILEREAFSEDWEDRCSFELTPLVKKMLAI